MKIASIVIVVVIAVVAGALYFSQPNRPLCDGNILAADLAGCDIKGDTK